jgi:hypothetical protein
VQTGFPGNLFNISNLNTPKLEKFITLVLFNQIWSNQFYLILNNVNYLGKLQNPLSIAKKLKFGFNYCFGQKLNNRRKISYIVRLRLIKIREVLNHSLICLKIVNSSVHPIKVGFTI